MDGCIGGYLCLCEGKLQTTCDRWSLKPWAYFVRLDQVPPNSEGMFCDPARPPAGAVLPAACSITEFEIPTANSGAQGLVANGDDIWFTESSAGKIARLAPSGTISEFPLPDPKSGPVAITVGPDGNLWFTESSAGKIGRITAEGAIDEFPLPQPGSSPFGIARGADSSLWFTESSAGKIGRISLTGTITEFVLPAATSTPRWITDSNTYYSDVLFAEFGTRKIGRINSLGDIAEVALPETSGAPFALTGTLWFSLPESNKIGWLSAFNYGTVVEFPLPTPNAQPMGITERAPGDHAWFTEYHGDKIGRISKTGVIAEFPLAPGSAPFGIAVGRDSVWFTEFGANKIGRLAACPDPVIPDPCASCTLPGYSCRAFDAGAPYTVRRCCSTDGGQSWCLD
jgi:virginiamycin B lyase